MLFTVKLLTLERYCCISGSLPASTLSGTCKLSGVFAVTAMSKLLDILIGIERMPDLEQEKNTKLMIMNAIRFMDLDLGEDYTYLTKNLTF